MVISGQDIFCHHIIKVKNLYILKLVYILIFKNRLKNWVKYKHNKTKQKNIIKKMNLLVYILSKLLISFKK